MIEPSNKFHPPRSIGFAASRRARAALTSGLLALAALVPGVSIASEPDTSQQGISAPEQTQDLETDSPGFDPGGETDLPFDAGPPPSSPHDVSPDDGLLESEPVDDPDGRVAPFVEPQAPVPGSPEDAPVNPLEGSRPDAPAAPGFSIEPPPPDAAPLGSAPTAPPTQALPAEPGSQPTVRRTTFTAVVRVDRAAGTPADTTSQTGSPEAATDSGQALPSEAPHAMARSVAANDASERNGTGRIHVVRPGESLWTIAEKLLGPGSSAMAIAAEVARLWELNRERIRSGDPDLIAVGQRLRLR